MCPLSTLVCVRDAHTTSVEQRQTRITDRAMFANLLVGYVQFHHGSTETSEVGCTQRVVVVVQILTVHTTRIRQHSYNLSVLFHSIYLSKISSAENDSDKAILYSAFIKPRMRPLMHCMHQ